jgi:hypothetical protein
MMGQGVEHPAIHIDEAEFIKMLMPGITTIEEEGVWNVGITIVVRKIEHPFISGIKNITGQ